MQPVVLWLLMSLRVSWGLLVLSVPLPVCEDWILLFSFTTAQALFPSCFYCLPNLCALLTLDHPYGYKHTWIQFQGVIREKAGYCALRGHNSAERFGYCASSSSRLSEEHNKKGKNCRDFYLQETLNTVCSDVQRQVKESFPTLRHSSDLQLWFLRFNK